MGEEGEGRSNCGLQVRIGKLGTGWFSVVGVGEVEGSKSTLVLMRLVLEAVELGLSPLAMEGVLWK